MKTFKLFFSATCILLLQMVSASAQNANQKLSNLTSPTAVNQNLIPATNDSFSLGSSKITWKNIYSNGSIFLNSYRFLSNGGNTNNLFVGTKAGNTTTGIDNVFCGSYAGYLNTSGHDNTAIGYFSLYSNTVTYENTAVGSQSLFYNSSGYYNTAIGYSALHNNVSGYYNTAVGTQALSLTTSSGNTALGERAGSIYDNGWGNTFIGQEAWANAGGYQYSTCIGYDSHITASNQVRIGNNTTTSIGGYKGWSNLSDGRFKKNIKENVPGLDFINKLTPITYTVDVFALQDAVENKTADKSDNNKYSDGYTQALNAQSKVICTGFIAQEVEKAAKDLNYDFDGVDAPKNSHDLYGLRYAEFVVPLVKAVQELSKMNNAKDARIDLLQTQAIAQQKINADLQNQINELKSMIVSSNQSSANNQISTAISSASLAQNVPNPFSNTTTINYSIPQQFISARIIITDKNGSSIKTINISGGKGSVKIDASTLSSGAYQYSLYLNNKLIDTKQMVSAK